MLRTFNILVPFTYNHEQVILYSIKQTNLKQEVKHIDPYHETKSNNVNWRNHKKLGLLQMIQLYCHAIQMTNRELGKYVYELHKKDRNHIMQVTQI